ncbi:hypothetical protein Ae168Ps1_3337 [Pseudonocardia sp. Ae168_Ps1]|nr:hypothetical protein Ae150APs1_3317 [Pseudonocardia sp. Ae150A_Ps1]OLL80931.1 hypothetical protein Ae168Ps1_3337 [Pseudonocardia sp. Ae168_Ps1]OLL84951.1 hypothetical protein Ae263Ps1_2006c [Pseudonocardia sp. Ae263_Ps1]OLL95032.1 hypothetical protein Ae356Ps1_4929 [Pseudonocardia sp. Ae356_Ps1]
MWKAWIPRAIRCAAGTLKSGVFAPAVWCTRIRIGRRSQIFGGDDGRRAPHSEQRAI